MPSRNDIEYCHVPSRDRSTIICSAPFGAPFQSFSKVFPLPRNPRASDSAADPPRSAAI